MIGEEHTGNSSDGQNGKNNIDSGGFPLFPHQADEQHTNVVQYLTARMQSVSDMENITTLISDINMDGCLNLDLMENDLNDLNLIKGVILEEWM